MHGRHGAEGIGGPGVELLEIAHAEEVVDAQQARRIGGGLHVDGTAVQPHVPGRCGGNDQPHGEADHMGDGEGPEEEPHALPVLDEEVERIDRHDIEESGIGDGEEDVPERRRVPLQPVARGGVGRDGEERQFEGPEVAGMDPPGGDEDRHHEAHRIRGDGHQHAGIERGGDALGRPVEQAETENKPGDEEMFGTQLPRRDHRQGVERGRERGKPPPAPEACEMGPGFIDHGGDLRSRGRGWPARPSRNARPAAGRR